MLAIDDMQCMRQNGLSIKYLGRNDWKNTYLKHNFDRRLLNINDQTYPSCNTSNGNQTFAIVLLLCCC